MHRRVISVSKSYRILVQGAGTSPPLTPVPQHDLVESGDLFYTFISVLQERNQKGEL